MRQTFFLVLSLFVNASNIRKSSRETVIPNQINCVWESKSIEEKMKSSRIELAEETICIRDIH